MFLRVGVHPHTDCVRALDACVCLMCECIPGLISMQIAEGEFIYVNESMRHGFCTQIILRLDSNCWGRGSIKISDWKKIEQAACVE